VADFETILALAGEKPVLDFARLIDTGLTRAGYQRFL
jgi:hypothetical protein